MWTGKKVTLIRQPLENIIIEGNQKKKKVVISVSNSSLFPELTLTFLFASFLSSDLEIEERIPILVERDGTLP